MILSCGISSSYYILHYRHYRIRMRLLRKCNLSSDVFFLCLGGRWQNSRLWNVVDQPDDVRLALALAGYGVFIPEFVPVDQDEYFTLADYIRCAEYCSEYIVRNFSRNIIVLGYSFGSAAMFLIKWGEIADINVLGLIGLDGSPVGDRVNVVRAASQPVDRAKNPAFVPRFRAAATSALASPEVLSSALIPHDKEIIRYLLVGDICWPLSLLRDMETIWSEGYVHGIDAKNRINSISFKVIYISSGGIDRSSRRASLKECLISSDLTEISFEFASHTDIVAGSVSRQRVIPAIFDWLSSL